MDVSQKIKGRARQRGITLIEVLMAGIVLLIAAVALAATMAQSHGLANAPREEVAARNAAQAAIAGLASTPFDQVAALYHKRGFPVPGLTPLPGDADGLPGEVVFAYGPGGDTSFYTVTVRVRWRGTTGERGIETIHYLANVRGDTGEPPSLAEIEAGQAGGQ
jgi:hypothetical protein